MRLRFACARCIGAALLATLLLTTLGSVSAEAAVSGAALVAAPAALAMGWIVGLAIFPPAALLALTFLVALLTDRMA